MTEWKNGIAQLTLPTPFPVGDVHAFLIKGDRLTLVDAGPKTEEAWEAFKTQLKDLSLAPDDIEQVVLTHHHPDHVGGLDFLSPSLDVFGHFLNERWINRTDEFLQINEQFHRDMFYECGVPEQYLQFLGRMKGSLRYSCDRPLTSTISEGDSPPGLEDWKVVETPGHAQSHIMLLREKDGVAIGGDHILANISPNPILEPPHSEGSDRPRPLVQYNQSLKKLLDYPVKTVYAGHGPEVYELDQLIGKRLERQHSRAMQVKEWLKIETLSVFELCRKLFPKVFERELSLAISETVGQIDYLLSIGEVEATREGKKLLYSAAK